MNRELNQKAFGRNAESYAVSKVHAKGASLARMVELVKPAAEWTVLDVATGAGHTAFAFAPHVRLVRATDLTGEMLEVASREAAARGLENVVVEYAEAEQLPYQDGTYDLVTCRIAAHHFSDLPGFVREAARVLRAGGMLAVVDNIVPSGTAGAYINAFEKLRDPSHGRCLSRDEWVGTFDAAGFDIVAEERLRKAMAFSFWAGRHDADMQSFLLAMLALASGEAAGFLSPEVNGAETVFYLEEGLFVLRKRGGPA